VAEYLPFDVLHHDVVLTGLQETVALSSGAYGNLPLVVDSNHPWMIEARRGLHLDA
jgi:hypothetical protein